MHGFTGNRNLRFEDIEKELAEPTDMRIFSIAEALEAGMSVERIYQLTKIDKWFLFKLRNIISIKDELCNYQTLESVPTDLLSHSKINGFSDFQIARHILKSGPDQIHQDLMKVRAYRKSLGIVPYIKQIDTLAAEYPAVTNYLYLTYSGS